MFKFFYLANHKPDFTPETFVSRWRQHGQLAMSLPFWRRVLYYTQADVIRPVPMSGASSDYDGVSYFLAGDDGLFTNPSEEDIENIQVLLEDELKVLRAPVSPMSLVLEERGVRSGARGGTTAYLCFIPSRRSRWFVQQCKPDFGLNRRITLKAWQAR